MPNQIILEPKTFIVRGFSPTPPIVNFVGALYIVGNGATGDWAGMDGYLAFGLGAKNGWEFTMPLPGFYALVCNTNQHRPYAYQITTGWTPLSSSEILS